MNTPHGTAAQPLAAVLAGSRSALARAITRVENEPAEADRLAARLRGHLGRAHVLGITGPPGAGKSTLIGALLGALLARGAKLAVVAVDPSSPVSGGSVLGDRIRMGEHAGHENCFIRSLSARGELGGLSRATGAIVDLLDAAGFDTVIVETVGTGQSEVALARLADTCVVLCPPAAGDEVQALKAGILELAELLVVSKADDPASLVSESQLREMLGLRPRSGAWQPRVLRVAARTGDGLEALIEAIDEHRRATGCGRRLRERDPGAASEEDLCARLAARDPYLASLGAEFIRGRAGSAEVALDVRREHLNFNGSCHGGVIFALADTAFGLASNGHGSLAAGIDAHITYHTAVHAGSRIVARARELSRGRRLAVVRVDVERADGVLVAAFTGTVYLTGRRHSPGPEDVAGPEAHGA